MLSVCKTNNYSKIIGFAHATMRFWDLRYFNDRRDFFLKVNYRCPAKFLALNSKSALNLLEKMVIHRGIETSRSFEAFIFK